MQQPNERPLGLRVIIGYKLTKAPLMVAFALWLSVAPRSAVLVGDAIARDLSESGWMLHRIGLALAAHLTNRLVTDAAIVAWIDGISTAAEGLLLLQGSAWGEWIVVAALAALVPVEAVSLERHPSLLKVAVLASNALIVAYLVFMRVRRRARSHPRSTSW